MSGDRLRPPLVQMWASFPITATHIAVADGEQLFIAREANPAARLALPARAPVAHHDRLKVDLRQNTRAHQKMSGRASGGAGTAATGSGDMMLNRRSGSNAVSPMGRKRRRQQRFVAFCGLAALGNGPIPPDIRAGSKTPPGGLMGETVDVLT